MPKLVTIAQRLLWLPSDLIWAVMVRLDRRPLHEQMPGARSITEHEYRQLLEDAKRNPAATENSEYPPEFLATPLGRAIAAIEKKNRRPWWRPLQ